MKKLLNKKGFTIVELVIVIAVIAILAAVLIPTFSNVIESANKTAALQEAKSTLDSYIGVMSADGSSLPDATVFVVYESEKDADAQKADKVAGAYIYFKASLHEFDYSKIQAGGTLLDVPYTVADKKLKATKQIIYSETPKDFTSVDEYYFYFNDVTPVDFPEGSKKCKIYAGTFDPKNITLTVKADVALTEVKSESGEEVIGYTLSVNAKAEKIITFTASSNSNLPIEYKLNETALASLEPSGKLTIKAYSGTSDETITVTAKVGNVSKIITITVKNA